MLDALVAALEAKPDEGRTFCIPNLNGPERIVVHKGLPSGSITISRGMLDELVQGGLLAKVAPGDKRNCLFALTALAKEHLSEQTIVARTRSLTRRAAVVAAAAIGLAAAIVMILAWAGVGPTA